MNRIALVRAPFTYRYNNLDVREEVILTQLAHYLGDVGVPHEIFDFHLARETRAEHILGCDPTAIVIAVRETGDNAYYALRLARHLSQASRATVVLYGQTARLKGHALLPATVKVVGHSEAELARTLGLSDRGPAFGDALRVAPYFDRLPLEPWQTSRVRGTIETTRGCPFPCNFCFINSGKNHDRRWQRQSVAGTIGLLGAYVERGVRAFVFHDSEFIGGSRSDLAHCQALIEALHADVPDIAFKIYARADTILKVPDLGRLRDAGLVSVFMGVESFVQSDLDELKKALSVGSIDSAISTLGDHDIYMDLSFILFNHCTTVATLRVNLEKILALYASSRARLLGMPHFTFSFESAWRKAATRSLSGRTYLDWDVRIKMPAADGAVFDAGLEPLMEIYRLLAYEWSKKVILLSHARDTADAETKVAIESWFRGLGAFCARTMLAFLGDFERGRLDLGSLEAGRERLYGQIEGYYGVLPTQLRGLVTSDTHGSAFSYDDAVALVEADEYWATQIPDPEPRTHDERVAG